MWTKITSDEKTLPPLGVPILRQLSDGRIVSGDRSWIPGEERWCWCRGYDLDYYGGEWHLVDSEEDFDDAETVAWYPLPGPYVEEKPE